MVVTTYSSEIDVPFGVEFSMSEPPADIAWATTASSNSFLQTDHVLVLSGDPISTKVPPGPWILAPHILVRAVDSRPTFSIEPGFTKPAH